jgi:ribonuclease P protein component
VDRKYRLTRSSDFKRVKLVGKSFAHSLIVVIAAPNALSYSRTAVAAGRSVGNAVRRNRAKRLRVCIDSLHLSLRSGWDVIIYARKPITFANFSSIQKEVFMSFSDAGILLKDN